MKKILIMAVAGAMGIMAHASTVAWNITGVKGIDGAALNAGSVYVFFVETASGKADRKSVV